MIVPAKFKKKNLQIFRMKEALEYAPVTPFRFVLLFTQCLGRLHSLYGCIGVILQKASTFMSQTWFNWELIKYEIIFLKFFKNDNLWRPLTPVLGKIEICAIWILCRKFNCELLYEAIFDLIYSFCNILPKMNTYLLI